MQELKQERSSTRGSGTGGEVMYHPRANARSWSRSRLMSMQSSPHPVPCVQIHAQVQIYAQVHAKLPMSRFMPMSSYFDLMKVRPARPSPGREGMGRNPALMGQHRAPQAHHPWLETGHGWHRTGTEVQWLLLGSTFLLLSPRLSSGVSECQDH